GPQDVASAPAGPEGPPPIRCLLHLVLSSNVCDRVRSTRSVPVADILMYRARPFEAREARTAAYVLDCISDACVRNSRTAALRRRPSLGDPYRHWERDGPSHVFSVRQA